MLALLSVTGMRVSEVVNLDRDDVDLAGGVLSVRDSKFGKSRYLPMHASTTQALRRYARRRDRLCLRPLVPAFFLAERGTRITEWALRWTFAKLSKQVGLRAPSTSHGTGPRLHDLRHRFGDREDGQFLPDAGGDRSITASVARSGRTDRGWNRAPSTQIVIAGSFVAGRGPEEAAAGRQGTIGLGEPLFEPDILVDLDRTDRNVDTEVGPRGRDDGPPRRPAQAA